MRIITLILCLAFFQFCTAQNVGIGTSTPTQPLEVSGTIKATNVMITSGGNNSDFLKKGTNDQVAFRKGYNGVGLNYIICTNGIYPSTGYSAYTSPLLGEIRLFAGNFPPGGFAFCQGQILTINSNTALFSLLGTTYGGNGTTNFALPDLRAAVPVGEGSSGATPAWTLGEKSQ